MATSLENVEDCTTRASPPRAEMDQALQDEHEDFAKMAK